MTEHIDSLGAAEKDHEKLKTDDRTPEVPPVPCLSTPQEISRADCKARAMQVAEIFRQLAKYFND